MFTFNVANFGEYRMSIEKPTRLLVLEQVVEGEEFPRYIRMTGQQAEKFRSILFRGNFTSVTIPRNRYVLNKDVIEITCAEEKQVIHFPMEGYKEFDNYYGKHKNHIERFDAKFNHRRY